MADCFGWQVKTTMKKHLVNLAIVAFLYFAPNSSIAQVMPVNENDLSGKYPFISTVFNRISNNSGLDSFYDKLHRLKSGGSGTVSIVHIGDSHIQADFLTAIVRNGLQDFFGNAGRGLVFPYQLAQSNSPDDVYSSSSTRWQYNRIAHPEIAIGYGISGYSIKTSAASVSFQLSLRGLARPFTRVRLFADSLAEWAIKPIDNDSLFEMKKITGCYCASIELDKENTGFSLSSQTPEVTKIIYGASLENNNPGIIYHTIGVNGARFDQYNLADLFWEQLPALKADLFIISLGTNEAQWDAFPETAFRKTLHLFIEKLKVASPRASILFTTAPDSYKRRRYNAVLREINSALINYCNSSYLPVWDLYGITNGYGSANSWARRGLMSSDRIHFTPEGYRLQGSLLLSALAKGYNGFTSLQP
jgi:lysophospholipase L1-like esterase